MPRAVQGRLFPAGPLVVVPRLTDCEREVLVKLEVAGGLAAWWGEKNRNRVVRELVRKGLIEVMGLSPAIYRVTRLGVLARRVGR